MRRKGNRHNRHWIIIIVSCCIGLLLSCSKNDEGNKYVPGDEITSSETVMIPDRETKVVSTLLTFDNIDAIDYVSVRKDKGDYQLIHIAKGELSSPYRFSYTIQSADPEAFQFVFRAHYKDGNMSNRLYVSVDNKWGISIRSVTRIARVTGRSMSGEDFPNPNNTLQWNVGGTDLGIIWEMNPGEYGVFFGDTFGNDFTPNYGNPGPNGSHWRSNFLAFSTDNDLSDGLTLYQAVTDNAGHAKELVYGGKQGKGGNITSIPTAAIRANGADYVHYFNMRDWDTWTTNYSGMYKSVDNGLNWSKLDHIVFSMDSNFGQAGYYKKDGYVYMVGTQTGRDSPAYVARFKEANIEDRTKYEYWNSMAGRWITGSESQATVVINDKVGELSVIYHEKYKKWIIAYFNGDRYNITMRTAADITGPWSEPHELVSGWNYAQLYGSYFHPLSTQGDDLYFLMSMWLPYNVFLMKVEIDDRGDFLD